MRIAAADAAEHSLCARALHLVCCWWGRAALHLESLAGAALPCRGPQWWRIFRAIAESRGGGRRQESTIAEIGIGRLARFLKHGAACESTTWPPPEVHGCTLDEFVTWCASSFRAGRRPRPDEARLCIVALVLVSAITSAFLAPAAT